jgi:hypothetical protein
LTTTATRRRAGPGQQREHQPTFRSHSLHERNHRPTLTVRTYGRQRNALKQLRRSPRRPEIHAIRRAYVCPSATR